MFPKKLQHKLEQRIENNSFRNLSAQSKLIDFSSNDYLGFSKSDEIFKKSHQYLIDKNYDQNGATGSRLLSGNHELYTIVEAQLKKVHQSEALIFNSGYDANIGFFSAVPQRSDIILYDEYAHASIRDGIRLSNAKAYSFKHNDLADLEKKLLLLQEKLIMNDVEVYVVTESVFSMDGDSPDLIKMTQFCEKYNALLVVDEAHALGVFERGLVQKMGVENKVFARIVTFGKALGCHGAAILGSIQLRDYLINFSRSFIYTTGLSPHSLATIKTGYAKLFSEASDLEYLRRLQNNIQYFKEMFSRLQLDAFFIKSDSAIQSCVISGNEKVKVIALKLKENGFDVRPILSPTVSKGQERLRFCLHSYNTHQEIDEVLNLLSTFVHD